MHASHHRLPFSRTLVSAAIIMALVAAPAAHAATRYASPTGGGATCDETAPCALADALSSAAAGDEVIVASGDYAIATTLRATVAVTVHGVRGEPRPRLVGDASLAGDTLSLSSGATARHLEIQASGPSGAALRLYGATGEDLVLVSSSGGAAAILRVSDGGTLLRDTLARCLGCTEGAIAFNGDTYGTAAAVGVTAVATGAASAIKSSLQDGTATVVNAATSSGGADIKASTGPKVRVTFSAFRPETSNGVSDGGGNVGAPVFADPAAGDYHAAFGSPTIDAGVADSRAGAFDLDGNPRSSGAAPDIGAYEATGAALGPAGTLGATRPAADAPTDDDQQGDDPAGRLAPGGAPVAGHSVAARPASGIVRVRLPGGRKSIPLGAAARLPLGAEIDARRGTVRLTSATDAQGGQQTGLFSGGRFRVRQTAGARPVTQLTLTGADFSRCRPRGSAARAAAKGPQRRLWGQDKGGRFTTIGHGASATVRGTRWLTQDTCEGTRVTVTQGAVDVWDRGRHRRVHVRAGHSYLARTRR